MRKPPSRNRSSISRRKLIGGLLVAGVGYSTVGGDAFTSASTTRENSIQTSEDSRGLVGLDIFTEVEREENEALVTITNNANVAFSYTLELIDGSESVASFSETNDSQYTTTLEVDGSETIQIDVSESGTETDIIHFSVMGASSETNIQLNLTRSQTQIVGDPIFTGSVEVTVEQRASGPNPWVIGWSSDGDEENFSDVELSVNGEFDETVAIDGTKEYEELGEGDTVTATLVDVNGNVVDTDTVEIDTDPAEGQISIFTEQRGRSGNYDIIWEVGGDDFERIEFFRNGTFQFEQTDAEGEQQLDNPQNGDEWRADLIAPDGTVLDTDTTTV